MTNDTVRSLANDPAFLLAIVAIVAGCICIGWLKLKERRHPPTK
jgi:hypothetical protein